jgi:Flp pilus assembly secretin CpaC
MKIATFPGLVIAVVCFLVRCADAQDPSPAPQAPGPGTYRVVAAPSIESELEQLQAIAERLASAGRKNDAQKLRELKSALSARFQALAAGAAEDRPTTSSSPQVLVRIKMIEASRTRLRRLGVDYASADGIRANLDKGLVAGLRVVDKHDKLLSALQALEKDGLVRVLAEPRLVTVSGRPASLQVGAEIPVDSRGQDNSSQGERKFAGTRVDLVPTVLDGGRIRLEVRLRVTEVDPLQTAPVAGRENPALRTWQVDTAVEVQSGHTAILGGLVQKRLVKRTVTTAAPAGPKDEGGGAALTKEVTEPEEFECLVLIAPEIVEPGRRVAGAVSGSSPR